MSGLRRGPHWSVRYFVRSFSIKLDERNMSTSVRIPRAPDDNAEMTTFSVSPFSSLEPWPIFFGPPIDQFAIACFWLLKTFFPDLPLLSVPFFFFLTARLTELAAFLPYFAIYGPRT